MAEQIETTDKAAEEKTNLIELLSAVMQIKAEQGTLGSALLKILEKNTEQLIETAKNERMFADLEIYLDGLQNKIEANKASDYLRFKSEIKSLLEEQIAFHYDLEDGRAKISLPRDEDVAAARKVLDDSAAYRKIIHPI